MPTEKERIKLIKSIAPYENENVFQTNDDWIFQFRTEYGTYINVVAINEAEIAQIIENALRDITGDLASLLGDFPALAHEINPRLVESMGARRFNELVNFLCWRLDLDDPKSEYPFILLFTDKTRFSFASKIALKVKWFKHFLNIGIQSTPKQYKIADEKIWIYEV